MKKSKQTAGKPANCSAKMTGRSTSPTPPGRASMPSVRPGAIISSQTRIKSQPFRYLGLNYSDQLQSSFFFQCVRFRSVRSPSVPYRHFCLRRWWAPSCIVMETEAALSCISLEKRWVIVFCLLYISFNQLTYFEYVGLFISAGISSGAFGITAAHELIHQRKFERTLSRFTLFTVCYPHFCIEHVHGHHINVATPKDPASAVLGQNVYNFFITSLTGSFINAWRIENNRLSRKRIKKLSLMNIMTMRYFSINKE